MKTATFTIKLDKQARDVYGKEVALILPAAVRPETLAAIADDVCRSSPGGLPIVTVRDAQGHFMAQAAWTGSGLVHRGKGRLDDVNFNNPDNEGATP